MRETRFFKQADLLVQVMPFVNAETCFALKGGTAIDFFVRDFPRLRESAFSAAEGMTGQDYRQPPADKSKIGQIVFVGFARCLQTAVKFQSDTERKMAAILDRDSGRWFKPAKGQFQIFYCFGSDHREYQPDFVAETAEAIYMLETKASNEIDDPEVVSKKTTAIAWCQRASDYTATHGGKPWRYVLIPHTAIADNMTLASLAKEFCESHAP